MPEQRARKRRFIDGVYVLKVHVADKRALGIVS